MIVHVSTSFLATFSCDYTALELWCDVLNTDFGSPSEEGLGRRKTMVFVYYESVKRELKRRLMYEYRCHERLKTKTEESTRLSDTGLVVELEHLKTKTRLIDKKFASVRGECEI